MYKILCYYILYKLLCCILYKGLKQFFWIFYFIANKRFRASILQVKEKIYRTVLFKLLEDSSIDTYFYYLGKIITGT